jgi:hypothetical protein
MRKILVLSLLTSVAACSGGSGSPSDPPPAAPVTGSNNGNNSGSGGNTPSFAQAGGDAVATAASFDFGTGSTTGSPAISTESGNSTVHMTMDANGVPLTLQMNITDGGPGIQQTFNISPDQANATSVNGIALKPAPIVYPNCCVGPNNGVGYMAQINAPDPNNGNQIAEPGQPTYQLIYAGASEPVANPSLSWTTYGYWTQTDNDGSGYGRFGSFAAGQMTAAANLPAAGTDLTYTGGVLGQANVGAGIIVLGGVSTLNVAFGAAGPNVTGSLNLVNVDTNATWENVALSGAINAGHATFNGSASTTDGLTGNFAGQFNGPAAQEVGGTWALSNAAGTVGALGAFGGKHP